MLRLSIFFLTAFYSVAMRADEIPLTDLTRLDLRNAHAEATIYRGVAAVRITEDKTGPAEALAVIKNLAFHNGAIDLEVSGAPSKAADGQARGFIGVTFRMAAGGERF